MDDLTPLHCAANYNLTDLVRLLLEKGADVNAVNKDGKTPLDLAEENGNKEVVDILRHYSEKD